MGAHHPHILPRCAPNSEPVADYMVQFAASRVSAGTDSALRQANGPLPERYDGAFTCTASCHLRFHGNGKDNGTLRSLGLAVGGRHRARGYRPRLSGRHASAARPTRLRLAFTNLAVVWPNYAAAGAERLIVAGVVEDRADLDKFRVAVPGAQPIVCRLIAPLSLMHERLRIREPGMFLNQALRAEELADILSRASVEDFVVDNGPGRSVGTVAREVSSLASWL